MVLPSRLRCRLISLAVVCTLVLGWSATTHAVELDEATLIEGLAKHGMIDLLDRFAAKHSGADPVIDQLIKIGRYRIAMNYGTQTRDQKIEAFDQMARAMRDLIDRHYDHEQRPLWQTDLAEQLLLDYLPRFQLYALEFCEFGVPTQEQRQARDQAVPEALELLSDADLRFFQLQADLPREPDHFEKRVATGLWDRMMKDYYKTTCRTCWVRRRTSPARWTKPTPITRTWAKTPAAAAAQRPLQRAGPTARPGDREARAIRQ